MNEIDDSSFMHPKTFHEVEALFASARQMETSLRAEHERRRALTEEFGQERSKLKALLSEARRKIHEYVTYSEKLKTQVVSLREQQGIATQQLKEYHVALMRARSEPENSKSLEKALRQLEAEAQNLKSALAEMSRLKEQSDAEVEKFRLLARDEPSLLLRSAKPQRQVENPSSQS